MDEIFNEDKYGEPEQVYVVIQKRADKKAGKVCKISGDRFHFFKKDAEDHLQSLGDVAQYFEVRAAVIAIREELPRSDEE